MTRGSAAASVALAPIAAIGMLLVMPSVALADNCSSLGDCWSTAAGAATAALGAALGGLGGLFGAGGTAGAGAGGGGTSSGGGAGGSWPAPPAQPAPQGPPKDVRTGKLPPRTIEDPMKAWDRLPKLDMDAILEQEDREFMDRTESARAIRG